MKTPSKNYALITGGTSGIGYELAKLAAVDGYNIILIARSIERMAEVKKELTNSFSIDVKIIHQDLLIPNA